MSSNVAIIGAASSKGQDYIQALLENGHAHSIVAIVINQSMPTKLADWVEKYQWKVIRGGNVKELLDTCSIDTAIVALPHDQHRAVTLALLEKSIFVVKEKPLGMNLAEVEAYKKLLATKSCLPLYTTVQRSTHPFFVRAKADLAKLGNIRSFTYTYTFNLANQTSGWRSDPVKSGGGVVLDMGYHALDVVNDLFGYPEKIAATFGYKYPEMQQKKLEDSSTIVCSFKDFEGRVVLDRHADKKEERLLIVGDEGQIELTPNSYTLTLGDKEVTCESREFSKIELIHKMFDVCLGVDRDASQMVRQFDKNVDTMRLIDAIYSQKKE